jgi:hypothetical protein
MPPVDAPTLHWWHHGCCQRVGGKTSWQGGTSMSVEENMALARRFMEARVVNRDLAAVDDMLAPNFTNHNKLVPGQEPDREDYLRGIAAFHAALSPGRLIIEDQVAGETR